MLTSAKKILHGLALAASCALILPAIGCGDEESKPPPRRGRGDGMDTEGGGGKPAPPAAAAPAGPAVPVLRLTAIDKVDEEYRRGFSKADWIEDLTGDINRDPFRAYLPNAEKPAAAGAGGPQAQDECAKRMVADRFGVGELRLTGIVQRGTKSYALFIDSKGLGHIVHRGDCLSRDKCQITDVAEDRVVGKIQPPPPPGQAAPPPVEKEWALHPQQMQLTEIGSP